MRSRAVMDFLVLFSGDYIAAWEFDFSLIPWFAKAAGLLHDYPLPARFWSLPFTYNLDEGKHPWILA